MIADNMPFRVVDVSVSETYTWYGRSMVKYKLVFDTGETAFLSRTKDNIAPLIGDVYHGGIEPNNKGEMTFKITAKRPPRSSDTGDKKYGTTGSQLFASWFAHSGQEGLSMEDYIQQLRDFQDML